MIECIEDAGPAEVREAEDRQRAQMTPPEHRFESADERRVREQTVEIDRRFGHRDVVATVRSEEHTSELQSLMRISYAVFCLKKKIIKTIVQRIVDTMTVYTP